MKSFLFVFLFFLPSLASAQHHVLKHSPLKYKSESVEITGSLYQTVEPFSASVMGSDEVLHFSKIKLSNSSDISAKLEINFENCNLLSDEFPEGDYFINISFYDEDKNILFSAQFVSSGGFSLAGSPTGLQAASLSKKLNSTKCFEFSGSNNLAIHQCMLYEPGTIAAGIKPVKFVSVRAYHLGAG